MDLGAQSFEYEAFCFCSYVDGCQIIIVKYLFILCKPEFPTYILGYGDLDLGPKRFVAEGKRVTVLPC